MPRRTRADIPRRVAGVAVVVGAQGFLGARLAAALAGSEPVVAIGRRPSGGISLCADLRDDAALDRVVDIARNQTVYYCANVGGRREAAARAEDAFRVNAVAAGRIAAVAQRLVYFSTDYVFSQRSDATDESPPDPGDLYGATKLEGERRVLAACRSALVVRVSGLFDESGTRQHRFQDLGTVDAPDDSVTSPTFVPDVIRTVGRWVAGGEAGVRHAVGPDALSAYEFLQLASLRWGFDVSPTLSTLPARRTTVRASRDTACRRPAEIFAAGAPPGQGAPGAVLVCDCVGVTLGARTWRQPGIEFWSLLASRPDAAVDHLGPAAVAGAYCPNRSFWRMLRRRRAGLLVLANNGPKASFLLWQAKYGFDRLFDAVINSERDLLTKPDAPFLDCVERMAGTRPIRLIDDQRGIVDAALRRGWTARLATRVAAWPVEEYAYPDGESLWEGIIIR